MPKIYTHTIYDSNDPMTGSAPMPSALAQELVVISGSSGDAATGSWGYVANSWGFDLVLSESIDQVATGTWGGIDYSWGLHTLPSESIDRFTLTNNDNPSVNQGIGLGEWDPFPIPPAPPEEPTKERDVTRYRKAYSSQRHQPQRIRYIQRRTKT